jgi:ComF family protein
MFDSHEFCRLLGRTADCNLAGMFRSRQRLVNQWSHFRLTGSRGLARLLAATLFPPHCCLCGFPGASLDLDLCACCRADLPWEAALHADALVALRYEHPIDQMIRELKYQGRIAHARVLGVLLAQAVRKCGAELPELLVPVPLHPARMQERGFNQATALARYAGLMLEISVLGAAVRRIRNTPSQTALGVEQRHRNVSGAFSVVDTSRLAKVQHVAVVDDVMTTGSTLSELRAVLLAAGVRRVDTWAAARVYQARPAFLSASSGGPSNEVSGTLPR